MTQIIPLYSHVTTINEVEYIPTLFPKSKGGWAIQKMRKDKLKNNPLVHKIDVKVNYD